MRLIIFAPAYFLLSTVPANADNGSEVAGKFFPLSVGNSWKFCETSPKKGHERCVVWSISDKLKDGYVLQVNPSEDDISILSERDGDIVDLDSGYHIFNSRAEVGRSWRYTEFNQKKKSYQFVQFYITYKGYCYYGRNRIEECISVSRSDPIINVYETVTYAESVGPVSIKTYSLDRRRLLADMRLRKAIIRRRLR